MDRKQRIRIGDLLVLHKLISQNQLQQALTEQKHSGRKLGRVLIDLGFIEEDDLLQLLSRQLDIPVINLKQYQFNPETVRRLPEMHARRYRALILDIKADYALVGMADPTDIFAFDELGRLLKTHIRQALVREADLLRAIDLVYRRTSEITSLAEALGEELSDGDYDLDQLVAENEVTDAPVIKLLQTMFEDAVQVGASDIHIEPDEGALRVRQRVDGVLHEQIIEGVRVTQALVTRLKLMAGLDISEKRLPQDGRFNIRVKNRNLDVRVATMPVQHGETVVMRLLDESANLLSLDELGMPHDLLPAMQRLIHRPTGMLLVTGPTGSGKTTTLYAALNQINVAARKIITVEDPVEYRLPRVNQVQVQPRIGLDFARVLRTALRQDPDVILVGEMRDQETAEIGLRAAMTGHLVLSTLHTNDAVSTVNRLRDMGAQGYLVAAALNGVIAQRLVRRVCDSCAEPYKPSGQETAWLRALTGGRSATLKHGHGCAYCNNTGYRGRIGVYELLEITPELADLLRRDDAAGFARAALEQDGFRPLLARGLDYAIAGITSLEEVLRLAGGLDELRDVPDITGEADAAEAG
ncbi:MAG TPA: GspE/PulE family protein [Gammaproteobacteria bacterium]|nr:GspE/PulE family protein [Gammaproteobacteria bacterium]HET7588432.1 GspE/PulE family protein [Gammaproteobacteria bacterium]